MGKGKVFGKVGLLSTLFLFIATFGFAQQLAWHNPLTETALRGRAQQLKLEDGFARLPKALKADVREPVWYLGQQAAGIYVEFETNSPNIHIRYKVRNGLNMPHMPTTGVSGVDLYAKGEQPLTWKWTFGKYKFTDTISFDYENLAIEPIKGHQYRLYLPLYNAVDWMEIGVEEGKTFKFINTPSKPIVVYGTSIAQGACATRPGLGWTNMFGRNFNQEVINLAFSGNGRLEQPIIDLINDIDASAYLLDCIPNLALSKDRSKEQLRDLIVNAVSTLRKKHPKTPIMLMAHSSSEVPGIISKTNLAEYGNSSVVAFETFKELKAKGDKNLYWVSSQDIGFDIDCTVDYAHPNDIGMKKISDAYTKVLKPLLK
ncbi:SGNH/GDSL hydrolase family protein [Sphingobacterium humi]|uniref:Hydrolase n=1 Tax=Sphingobacterium humi TaxID=1796905 RepID=A0A6N8L360_9SPHI|nr:SGNH/GDSL hydrolase family protein [Sphingobacterium humi]MVZ62222.1 hydrolase [Sphingobacterium humi]